jgi:hypothetical protein
LKFQASDGKLASGISNEEPHRKPAFAGVSSMTKSARGDAATACAVRDRTLA